MFLVVVECACMFLVVVERVAAGCVAECVAQCVAECVAE